MCKKWRILSRLGELLNTQRNVHFFASRTSPGRTGQGEVLGGYLACQGEVLRTTPYRAPGEGAIGEVLDRGGHYSRAPFGRSTTLLYCVSNAVALHSLRSLRC